MNAKQIPDGNLKLLGSYQKVLPQVLVNTKHQFQANGFDRIITILDGFWQYMTQNEYSFFGYSDPMDEDLSIRIKRNRMMWVHVDQGVDVFQLDWKGFFNTFRTEINWYLQWSDCSDLHAQLSRLLDIHDSLRSL